VEQAGTELGWWMEMMTLDALARLLLSIEEGRKGVGGSQVGRAGVVGASWPSTHSVYMVGAHDGRCPALCVHVCEGQRRRHCRSSRWLPGGPRRFEIQTNLKTKTLSNVIHSKTDFPKIEKFE
jgi:hypothetical protein